LTDTVHSADDFDKRGQIVGKEAIHRAYLITVLWVLFEIIKPRSIGYDDEDNNSSSRYGRRDRYDAVRRHDEDSDDGDLDDEDDSEDEAALDSREWNSIINGYVVSL